METIPYILATAGHVDHGKSAVVRALTGIDPDRLPEEKLRGITIDLGFAHLMLDTAGARYRVGIIDVPGHEDFVKNMVAGVGSIDVALLIVAADDGWMPQTEEHLQILSYLGVTQGVVALTKIDLAGDREQESIDAIRQKLRGSSLADAPIVPTSVVDHRGFDELKRTIATVLSQAPQPRDIGRPRLPIDRVFTLKGVGTVVTGTLSGGALRRGQSVILQPGGTTTRARSIQSHNHDVEFAQPGSRVALNLPDIETSAIGRGDIVTLAEIGSATETIDVALERSDRMSARALKTGTRLQVHHGSAAVPARVQLLESNELKTGQRTIARLRLERALFVLLGDRFILRDWSQQGTLAGGAVLDVHPSRVPDVTMLQRRAAAPGDARVLVETELARAHAVDRSQLLMQSTLDRGSIDTALQDDRFTRAGELVADRAWWQVIRASAIGTIDEFHRKSPERPGLPLADLRRSTDVADAVFDGLLSDLCADGFVRDGAVIRRSSHHVQLPPRLQAAGDRLRAALMSKPFDPPSRAQLITDPFAQQALKFLVANREAVEIGTDVILSSAALGSAIETIRQHIRAHGPATVSVLKNVLNSSRRIMVPLLERLDRDGITRRDGDRRSLR